MDIFKEIEEAGDKVREKQEIDLGPISRLADRQKLLESKSTEKNIDSIYGLACRLNASIEDLEEALKKRKKDLYNVRQVQIPELMKEFGLDSITTINGAKIKIQDGVSVTTKDQSALFIYLRKHNAGDLIKNQIIIPTDNEESRIKITKLLEDIQAPFEEKASVHSATLKKYVKDKLKEGIKIPEKIVSTFEYKVSKVK